MRMVRNGVVADFGYINGIPATITFNGNTFYYVVNGQGDVTGITDGNGVIQVTYYYDAWGASSSVYNSSSDYGLTLATINPLRYRGYVFDWEVGLYYLQSRFYIPEVGRWLNGDSIIDTGDFLGYNLFTYCDNNAVNKSDHSGLDGKAVELGNGWYYRIDPADTSTGTKRHIHIWNNRKGEYIQNDDGSPHDKHKGKSGKLPKWLNKSLKKSAGWDYNQNRESFFEDTELKARETDIQYTFADGSIGYKGISFSGYVYSSTDSLEGIYRDSSMPNTTSSTNSIKSFFVPILGLLGFVLPQFGFSWGLLPLPIFG